ncbi:MAG: MATE family efflux transporter [Clostridia bacterium]
MNKYDITNSQLKLSKQLFTLSLPAMVSLAVQALYNIVDRLFIGNIPELAIGGLAALTAINPILNIIIAIGTMFGVGGAVFYSLSLGKGDYETSKKILGNTCLLLAVSNIAFVALIMIFFDTIVSAIGIEKEIIKLAKTYFFAIAPFSIFWAVGLGMNNFIRADGKAKFAMITILSGAITNILLDALFILVFKMGILGAGLATGLAQLISFVFVMYFFRSKHCRFRLNLKDIRFNFARTKRISYYGIPSLITVICNSILNLFIIWHLTNPKILKGYDMDAALAVQGIIFSLLSLLHIPIHAFSQGMQPLVGYNYGKQQYDNVFKVYKIALKYTMIISTAVSVLVLVFSEYIVMAFDGSRELGAFGPNAVRLWNFLLPLVAFEMISIALFQAMGRGKICMLLVVFRQLLVLLALIALLTVRFGIWGIYISMPIADVLTSILIVIILYVMTKKIKVKVQNEK